MITASVARPSCFVPETPSLLEGAPGRGGSRLQLRQPSPEITEIYPRHQFLNCPLDSIEDGSDEIGIDHIFPSRFRVVPGPAVHQNLREYRCSRKPLSFAVALN